jgi:hypothetical protein
MDEWWNDLNDKVQKRMIKDYLEEVGADLMEEKNE